MQRQRGNQALAQAEKEIASANNDPYKIALALARIGINAPGLERSLGPLSQAAITQGAANRSANAPLAGEGQPQTRQALEPPPQQQQLPERGFGPQQGQNQNFPTNIGPQGGPGNAPQPATTGVVEPLLTRDERICSSKGIACSKTKSRNPIHSRRCHKES